MRCQVESVCVYVCVSDMCLQLLLDVVGLKQNTPVALFYLEQKASRSAVAATYWTLVKTPCDSESRITPPGPHVQINSYPRICKHRRHAACLQNAVTF